MVPLKFFIRAFYRSLTRQIPPPPLKRRKGDVAILQIEHITAVEWPGVGKR
jgi:hypothetical protein